MRFILLIIAVILLLNTLVISQNEESEIDFLYDFLSGSYEVIGRLPDSDELYNGKVLMQRNGDSLKVVREISGKQISAIGRIETATADGIKVLRVRFTGNDRLFEITYLIQSDLDNYARLTDYLYLKNGGTKKPGIEALFVMQDRNHSELSPKK